MEFTVEQIANLLGAKIKGDPTLKINSFAKIQEGHSGAISFLANPKYEEFIYTTKSSAIIVSESFVPKQELEATLLVVADAYLAFSILLEEYTRLMSLHKSGREEMSFISSSASLGDNVYIGSFAYIGDRAKIGSNTKIYPQVYIGADVVMGNNCILYPGVKIMHGCKLGDFCTLQAGAVVGSDGFGFAPQPDGSYKSMPQIGNVVIGDHVDIGANTTIDRATMGSTIIANGVKLDNLIMLAHNVEVGEHTAIAAQSGISGSTKVGKNCIVAGQVGMAGHISIADGVKIGAQSGIMKGIEEKGKYVMGSPAVEMKSYLRSVVVYQKLPELQKRIEELEKKMFGQ
jgi:UDP-3-O-[3-hydroxymyristoyl] glucosamine N-acyltransferase